jgi:hypothetical protein
MLRCHAIAQESGADSATDLHLLFGLMSNIQILNAFRKTNLDFEKIFTPENLGLTPGAQRREVVPVDQTVNDVLAEAGKVAAERKLRRITAELLALICVKSSPNCRALLALDPEQEALLESEIEKALADPS